MIWSLSTTWAVMKCVFSILGSFLTSLKRWSWFESFFPKLPIIPFSSFILSYLFNTMYLRRTKEQDFQHWWNKSVFKFQQNKVLLGLNSVRGSCTSKSIQRILLLKSPERRNYSIVLWSEPWGQFHSETPLKYEIGCKIHLFKSNFIMYLLQSPKPRQSAYSNKLQGVGMLQASSSLETPAWGLWRPTRGRSSRESWNVQISEF